MMNKFRRISFFINPYTIGLLSVVWLFQSCQKIRFVIDKTEKIEGSYQNSNSVFGSGPTFKITSSSGMIVYDEKSVKATNLGNGTIRISIDGVRSKYKIPHELDTVKVQEKIDSKWKKQDEFQNNVSKFKSAVSAVLVLDISSSIGDNIDNVKQYAKDFITEIYNANQNSEIAVIMFSKNVAASSFYKYANRQQLINFIDNNKNYEDRTTLYEACNQGITLLNANNNNKVKAEIIFTDGGDNNTDNPETVLKAIQASTISRYAIGVDGTDFDKQALKDICTEDNWVKARNYDNLKKVFKEVSYLVSNVYRIEYDRSDQTLENAIDIRFKVKFKN
ncbi:MAG: VWA domain-containing protein [Bacteroidia bacterium]|nr:VWA domain-containing protein [Bacteroidia bacterium]